MIVIASTFFNTDGFAQRNLNIGNMFIVPQRLKEGVGKPNDFNILHHFFAKVVVNPVNLLFLEYLIQLFVQLLSRQQVVAEWLLDD
ncbi:hypothetical protein D3C76_1638080 [compost metagenome]